jgi:EAL domain-containing protein (putative c-di-GMP-specific phosphodiesterase class I)
VLFPHHFERTVLPIGNWVLREACKQAQAWVNEGLPLATMAVNIPAIEFNDATFLEGVLAILEDTGLDRDVSSWS